MIAPEASSGRAALRRISPRVVSEILCGRGGEVHEGRIMALGHGRVFTPRLSFVRYGR